MSGSTTASSGAPGGESTAIGGGGATSVVTALLFVEAPVLMTTFLSISAGGEGGWAQARIQFPGGLYRACSTGSPFACAPDESGVNTIPASVVLSPGNHTFEVNCTASAHSSQTRPGSDAGSSTISLTVIFTPVSSEGACCVGNDCSEESEAQCGELGGTFLGPGTSCGDISCEEIAWSNPVGGDFATADNWTPPRVPDHGTERSDTAVFGLSAQYPVNATGARAGRFVVKDGILDLTGDAQVFNTSLDSPSLLVGGAGILNVLGGTFESVNAVLGDTSGQRAEVAVLNDGTRWVNRGRLLVGDGGPAKLSIVNGIASALETRIGGGALAGGDVVVGGAMASWETGNLAVGFAGPARLEIRDGGTVASRNGSVGRVLAGEHVVEVGTAASTGDPSRWLVSEILFVGDGGPGLVEISEGGEVEVIAGMFIGSDGEFLKSIGEGAVRVSGGTPGGHRAKLAVVDGPASVGAGGPGVFAVRNGGLAEIEGSLFIGLTTDGEVTVEGRSSGEEDALAAELKLGDDLIVGEKAAGVLRVANGGSIEARSLLACIEPGSTASIIVDGGGVAGGLLLRENSRLGGADASLDLAGAAAALTVTGDGLAIFEKDLELGGAPGGPARLRLFDEAQVLVKETLHLGRKAETEVEVANGGFLFVGDFSSVADDGDYPVRAVFRGTRVGGPPSALQAEAIFWNRGDLIFTGGARGEVADGLWFGSGSGSSLQIEGAPPTGPSKLVVEGDALIGVEGNSGVEISEGGLLEIKGNASVGLLGYILFFMSGSGTRLVCDKNLDVGGKNFDFLVALGASIDSGPVNVDCDEEGAMRLEHPEGGLVWNIRGKLDLAVGDGTGRVEVNLCSGRVAASGPARIGARAELTGGGSLAAPSTSVDGTLRPGCPVAKSEDNDAGTPPGTLTLEGDVELNPGARVVLRVFGPEPGMADRIEVAGAFSAGGTLEVRFPGGYLPSAGDELNLLGLTGPNSGSFDAIVFPDLAPGFQFNGAFTEEGFKLTALTDASGGDDDDDEDPQGCLSGCGDKAYIKQNAPRLLADWFLVGAGLIALMLFHGIVKA